MPNCLTIKRKQYCLDPNKEIPPYFFPKYVFNLTYSCEKFEFQQNGFFWPVYTQEHISEDILQGYHYYWIILKNEVHV